MPCPCPCAGFSIQRRCRGCTLWVYYYCAFCDTQHARTIACAVRYAPFRYFDEQGLTDIPLFVSGTLVDQSGRTLSGQTTEVWDYYSGEESQ